jgi:hypothetical protein
MNDRIREFAVEACKPNAVFKKYIGDIDCGMLMRDEELERFAELIVRECMDNLEWHGHDEAVSQLKWFKVNRLGIK